ncbi:signal transduction histidine kinase [Thamnocephalis sphaerospora]|uniref:Signal transduction histidine kinase n=1 Tax=Thamnocephalis sphaerospora TaxID=78915 RepID=A0A4P9XZJ3_9FUNG|nr:signal transduction histidine kinase [Thamnocephalis sphaerospora]|eukprot:RKP10900.1 signal transduction histidine kinase [Thamnocephalis sphaerospora]
MSTATTTVSTKVGEDTAATAAKVNPPESAAVPVADTASPSKDKQDAAKTETPKVAESSPDGTAEKKSEETNVAAAAAEEVEEEDDDNAEDVIDDLVFGQLLEMDDEDDDEHEFSKSIVLNFFEQATTTFEEMDQAIENKDLDEYARLGHFFKGSSATLGLRKVQETCEKIQHSQASADDASLPSIDSNAALIRGAELLVRLKREYKQAERHLCHIYKVGSAAELAGA